MGYACGKRNIWLGVVLVFFALFLLRQLLLPAFLVLNFVPGAPPLLSYVTAALRPAAPVSIETAAGEVKLDVYEPEAKSRGRLVIFPAANEQGKDDPRLVRFAQAFARTGLRVYMPTLPNINRQVFHPRVIEEMGGVLDYVQNDSAGRGDVAVLSFSSGTGPALIAAAKAEPAPDLLVSFGGYLDLANVIRFHTTSPVADPFGTWLFARYYAQFLPSPDAAVMYEIADRKWRDPEALIADLAAGLGTDGQAVLALLQNRDPEKVARLLAALPPALQEFMKELDPEPALSELATPVLLLHSRHDAVIPFEESVKLEAALSARGKPVRFWPLAGFDHVNPVLPPLSARTLRQIYLPEFWRLYQAAYQIIY